MNRSRNGSSRWRAAKSSERSRNRSDAYVTSAPSFWGSGTLPVLVEQVRGEVVVRVRVPDEAEELVEAARRRVARVTRLRRAEAPLAEAAGPVAGRAHDLGEGDVLGSQRRARGVAARVLAHGAVARVQAGQHRAARGRADGASGVEVGEADPLAGEPVQVRRLDRGLSVRAELAEAEVIGHDHDEVRRAAWRARRRPAPRRGARRRRREQRRSGSGTGGGSGLSACGDANYSIPIDKAVHVIQSDARADLIGHRAVALLP